MTPKSDQRPAPPAIGLVAGSIVVALLTACSAGQAASPNLERSRAEQADAAAAASDPPLGPMLTDSPPPLNELELKVIEALATLGVTGQPAEHSVGGAFIWSPLDNGSMVDVHAYPSDIRDGDFSVTGERVIAGITVRGVEYPSGIVRDRFGCDGINYQVGGSAPPGFSEFDAFLAELIDALGCGQHE